MSALTVAARAEYVGEKDNIVTVEMVIILELLNFFLFFY